MCSNSNDSVYKIFSMKAGFLKYPVIDFVYGNFIDFDQLNIFIFVFLIWYSLLLRIFCFAKIKVNLNCFYRDIFLNNMLPALTNRPNIPGLLCIQGEEIDAQLIPRLGTSLAGVNSSPIKC